MSTTTIGIRELQQNASKLVRDVQEGRAEYSLTVQGRETGVVLAKAPQPKRQYGVPLTQALQSGLWRREIPADVKERMLASIEAGRDAMGVISDGGGVQ